LKDFLLTVIILEVVPTTRSTYKSVEFAR